LTNVSPYEVLGDVITDSQYNNSEDEEVGKKDEDKDKKKNVAFKASTSSKSKGKAKKEASSKDEDTSDFDDEAMALLVCTMSKFMKKRGYDARKRRDHMKDHVRLCFECKNPNHIAANYPYKNDNEEDEKKKKGSGYVVTWDSD
jgi:hypothetical protein